MYLAGLFVAFKERGQRDREKKEKLYFFISVSLKTKQNKTQTLKKIP